MEKQKEGWTLVGHCAVDSGQLMVTDPCYISSHWESNEFTSTTDEDKNDFSYDGACVTSLRHTAGELGNTFRSRHLGVVTSTAGGDGVFPVYVRFERGNAMELRVMLDGAKLNKDGDFASDNTCECGQEMYGDRCSDCEEAEEETDWVEEVDE